MEEEKRERKEEREIKNLFSVFCSLMAPAELPPGVRVRVTKINVHLHDNSAVFAASCQGSLLCTGGGDGAARLWRMQRTRREECGDGFVYRNIVNGCVSLTHLATLKRHAKSVNSVKFSEDGRYLATAGDDGLVVAWDVKDVLSECEHAPERHAGDEVYYKRKGTLVRGCDGNDVYDTAWAGNNTLLVCLSNGRVSSYSLEDKEKDKDKENKDKENKEIQKKIVLKVINEDTLEVKELGEKRAHKDIVQGIAYNREENVVATISRDRSCRVFSMEGGKLVQKSRIEREGGDKRGKLISDGSKHPSFFRRMCFSSSALFLSSSLFRDAFTVNVFKSPYTESDLVGHLGPFPSSAQAVATHSNWVAVGVSRDLYFFQQNKLNFAFRVKDVSFLPVTDISPFSTSSFLVSSMDGFITLVDIEGESEERRVREEEIKCGSGCDKMGQVANC